MRLRESSTTAWRPSKLSHFGEVEVAHFHRRHYHVERFFAAGAHRHAHGLHFGQHFDQALIEAEITDAVLQFAVFDEKSAIAGHAGEDYVVRSHFAYDRHTLHHND